MKETRRILTLTLKIFLPATLVLAGSSPVATQSSAEAPDPQTTTKETSVPSASAILTALDEESRNNALIELEAFGPAASSWPLPDATEVAALWNDGHYDQALQTLHQLESAGSHFVAAIQWREPIVSIQRKPGRLHLEAVVDDE